MTVAQTFTVRLPAWRICALFRRNPLVRASHRVEALVLAVVVMVSLLAIPVAAAFGTAVYDSRRDVYAQQHLPDHGTLTDVPTPTSQAGVDAVTAALFMWAGVTTAAAVLLAGTRTVCGRIRARRWDGINSERNHRKMISSEGLRMTRDACSGRRPTRPPDVHVAASKCAKPLTRTSRRMLRSVKNQTTSPVRA
jgi:hypothetical protein